MSLTFNGWSKWMFCWYSLLVEQGGTKGGDSRWLAALA
jgi:hypothetical protein